MKILGEEDDERWKIVIKALSFHGEELIGNIDIP